MELYTLTKDFFPNERIDQFSSLIWTERFSSAGDVQLIVQPLPSVIAALAPGTMLGLRGQSEIMRVDTHTIKDGLLTVKGSSLVTFLNERVAFFPAIPSGDTGPIFGDRIDVTKTAGQFISQVVYDMVIAPVSFGTYWVGIDLDWNRDKIPNLYLGHIDGNGGARQMDFPLGPLYDGIAQLAGQEQVGFKLYLESATYSSRSYVLRFATYRGRDRTSEQSTNLMVRFSPSLDSLNGVQEVSSLVDYKNVIYVTYENQVTEHYPSYIDPANPPSGFDRRVLRVDAPAITLDPSHVAGFRDQVARDALAHHLYSQAVDGQVSAHRDYIFGRDYYLGDVIELQGYSGLISKARVTEYIRSQDQFGEQEYPTLAVLNPLDAQYTADLADDLYLPEWPTDPLFDDNWNPADIGNPDVNLNPVKVHPLPPFTMPKYPTYPIPAFPYDFNQDPIPDLGTPDVSPPPGGHVEPAPTSSYLVLDYYPVPSEGSESARVIGYLTTAGDLSTAWAYVSPFTGATQVEALGWTSDHTYLIVRSREGLYTHRYAYWLMSLGGTKIRLTETTLETVRASGPQSGGSHGWNLPGVIGCRSTSDWDMFVQTRDIQPGEYIYADRTYSDTPQSGHGVLLAHYGRGPIELYSVSGGSNRSISEMSKILGTDVFPASMRWSSFKGPYPSPDGSKLCMGRRTSGPNPYWVVNGDPVETTTGGTFDVTIGLFGSIDESYIITLGHDIDAADFWQAVFDAVPYLEDPRLSGFFGDPYSQSSHPISGGWLQIQYDIGSPYEDVGVWMSIDSSGLIGGKYTLGDPAGQFAEIGKTHWYTCNADGSGLTDILFDDDEAFFGGWSTDSTKLHAVVRSASGHAWSRWRVYDVATEATTHPLDYSSSGLIGGLYGPIYTIPLFSPDGNKIAWVIQNGSTYPDYPRSLWVANADGTGKNEVYRQADGVTDVASASDPNVLLLGGSMAWSFDSQKLVIADNRDKTSVWLCDVTTGELTKIWPGTGWDGSTPKTLYDLQTFND